LLSRFEPQCFLSKLTLTWLLFAACYTGDDEDEGVTFHQYPSHSSSRHISSSSSPTQERTLSATSGHSCASAATAATNSTWAFAHALLQRSSNNSIEGFAPSAGTSVTMLHKSLSLRSSSGGGAIAAGKGNHRIRCSSISSLNSDSVITSSCASSSGGSSNASQRAGSRRQLLKWGLLVLLMLATIAGIAVAAWIGGRHALMPRPAAVLLAPKLPALGVLPPLQPDVGYQVSTVLPAVDGVRCDTWFPGDKVRQKGCSWRMLDACNCACKALCLLAAF
jgi:hypothetical protein